MTALEKIKNKYADTRKEQDGKTSGVALPISTKQAVSATVGELGRLLSTYPVSIIATDKRLAIIPVKGWWQDEPIGRISELVFFDDDCWRYLHDHPAGRITRENFYQHG